MRAATRTEVPTLQEIATTWPPTVSVTQAATASGYSKSHLYAAIARGECPFKTFAVGGRTRILTASLVRVLSGEPDPEPTPTLRAVA